MRKACLFVCSKVGLLHCLTNQIHIVRKAYSACCRIGNQENCFPTLSYNIIKTHLHLVSKFMRKASLGNQEICSPTLSYKIIKTAGFDQKMTFGL